MAAIAFKKEEVKISVRDGSELVDVYLKNTALPMKFGCTRGNCGVCAMEVSSGMEHLTKKSELEINTLKQKGIEGNRHRLACQCAVNGDIEVSFVHYKETQ